MFEIPSPNRCPSSTNGVGWKPATPRSHGSRPEYDVSMCPFSISVGPPPVPLHVPSTFARPSSTCCHCTVRPSCSSSWRISAAIASSLPVKLGVAIIRLAVSTSRSRSTLSSVTEVRQHLLAEEADLVVPLVAPELEHDVGAAGVAVFLDRLDAVRGRARDRLALVEDRVGHLRL